MNCDIILPNSFKPKYFKIFNEIFNFSQKLLRRMQRNYQAIIICEKRIIIVVKTKLWNKLKNLFWKILLGSRIKRMIGSMVGCHQQQKFTGRHVR